MGSHRNRKRSSLGCTDPKKMAEFVPCVGSIQEVFRKSSTELRTVLGLSSVGTGCGASKEPLNTEMLHSAETSRTVLLKLVPQGS